MDEIESPVDQALDGAADKSETVLSAVDQLLAGLGESSKAKTVFAIQINGVDLYFRSPENLDEADAFMAGLAEFVQTCRIGALPPSIAEAAKELGTTDLAYGYCIHYWSAEPTRISLEQAMGIVRHPFLAKQITRMLDRAHIGAKQMFIYTKVMDEKKDSNPTAGDAP